MKPRTERLTNLGERFKQAGIDPTIDRWSEGIEHHPESEKFFKMLADIDWVFFDDSFCWKWGGDGDNGETLMYQLDLIFDLLDKERKTNK